MGGKLPDGEATGRAGKLPGNVVVLLLSLAFLLTLVTIAPLPSIPSWGWDVAVYRAGSKALIQGQNPYLPENIPRFADGAELATIPYFVYSPVFAVLFAPLALLPAWLTIRVWFLLNLILYLSSGLLIVNAMGWRLSQAGTIGITLGLALYPPLRTQMVLGQSAIVMLFLLALCFWLLKRERAMWAGVALSLSFFKPHLILLLPFLAVRRQWRLLTGFVIGLAVTTLPFIGLLDDWVRALINARSENIGYGCLPFSSLNMLLQCLHEGSGLSITLVWGALGAILIGLVFLLIPRALASDRQFDLQLSLVVVVSLLLLDNVRVADLVLLVLPLLVALHAVHRLSNGWAKRVLIGLLIMTYLTPYLAMVQRGDQAMWNLPVWYAVGPPALAVALVVLIELDLLKMRARA